LQQLSVFPATQNTIEPDTHDDITSDIDTSRITVPTETEVPTEMVLEIEKAAAEQVENFDRTVAEMEISNTPALPNEIQQLVKTYSIKDIFQEQAKKINLPQFYLKVPESQFNFGNDDNYSGEPLEKEDLLKGFELSKSDTNIAFDSITAELYRVDLDENKNEYTPTFIRIDGELKEGIIAYILDSAPKDSRVKNFTRRIMDIIGNMYPIPDKEIEKYISRILKDFTDGQFNNFANNEYT